MPPKKKARGIERGGHGQQELRGPREKDGGVARIIPGCSDLCATAKFLSPGSRYLNVWPGPPGTWAIPTLQFSGDTGRTRDRYMYEFLYKIVPCQ